MAVKKKEPSEILDLKKKYQSDIVKKLKEKYQYKNVHQVPRIEKVVINRGMGESTSNSKVVQASIDEFKIIFGQAPIVTKAKKSIASFKLRQGMPIGCKVTLRGDRMYGFMNKLFNLVLPKIRDFRGVSPRAFDKQANYTLGLREQLIFPEINYDKVDQARGFNITFVTNADDVEQSKELLSLLGMPFRK
jgi:large subunit ribosomal protein L5